MRLNRDKMALIRGKDDSQNEHGLHRIDNELYTFLSRSAGLYVDCLGYINTANYCHFNYDLGGRSAAISE